MALTASEIKRINKLLFALEKIETTQSRTLAFAIFHQGVDYTFCDHVGLLNLSRTLLVVSGTYFVVLLGDVRNSLRIAQSYSFLPLISVITGGPSSLFRE